MKTYRLDNYTVLRFRPKAAEFLKAYTTNTLDKPQNAFIDVKGRIVATAFQSMRGPDEAFVAVGTPFAERLQKHLAPYLDLNGVEMKPMAMKIYIDLENGRPVFSESPLPSESSDKEFASYRLSHFLPLQGMDFDEDFLLNVGDATFVSYEKGCYLGQEIIAKVHYRGKPAKKLVVKAENDCTVEERTRLTSVAEDPATAKRSGFLFIPNH